MRLPWRKRRHPTYEELEFDVELFELDVSDLLYRYTENMYNEAFEILEEVDE